MAYFVCSIMEELFQVQDIPVRCFSDNKSLVENIHSTRLTTEKRLRMDLASIKQSVSCGEVSVTWVPTAKQVADCLTKTGANFYPLTDILKYGKGLEDMLLLP